jgi:hypothetical protein
MLTGICRDSPGASEAPHFLQYERLSPGFSKPHP